MKYGTVICHKDKKLATITLNRPEKLNAFNDAMLKDFDAALDEAERDDEVRVVVIKGAGRAFSVGYDVSGVGTSLAELPDPRTQPELARCLALERGRRARWERVFNFPKATIAQVHGYCLDAGCHLAMVCDQAIAADDAVFGEPIVRMGGVSPAPFWLLWAGLKKGMEILLTGRYVDAGEAARIGLVNRVVPAAKLDEEVNLDVQAILALPFDGWSVQREGEQAIFDSLGFGAIWRHTSAMHVLGSFQKLKRGEYDFYKARAKKGPKDAVAARDAPFRKVSRQGGRNPKKKAT